MRRIFRYINLFFSYSTIVRFFKYKFKFPGIRIFPSVNIIFKGGTLSYSGENLIGEYSKLILNSSSNIHLGKRVWLGQNIYVEPIKDGSIVVDDNSSVQDNCRLNGDVYIGKNVILAPNVFISSGNHFFDIEPYLPIRLQDSIVLNDSKFKDDRSKKVCIEDDCWIGINAVIMRGVNIGKGAIVGANSVVTKDVPPYKVVGGIPAKVLRDRLKFIPPKKISVINSEDLPYFYSGFIIENFDNSNRKNLKLKTEEKFIISLSSDDAEVDYIYIILESNLSGHNISIVSNEESFPIVDGKEKYKFPVSFNEKNLFKFHFADLNNKPIDNLPHTVRIYILESGLE